MVDEEDRTRAEPGGDHVPELLMPARQGTQAVAAEFPEVAVQPVLTRAGEAPECRGLVRRAYAHRQAFLHRRYFLGISAPATGRRLRIRHIW